ncbi:MAG: GNAT family N-acetyltransferase [Candidatus Methanospirare jalkutatii]|nr:GNAT family N-acetyltransferase [Candidatus Methanospirare jalkutatii]
MGMMDEDEGFVMLGRVVGDKSARFKHRWFGILQVETEEGQILSLYMSGSVAQWLKDGERVEVKVLKEREEGKEREEREGGREILLFDEYELFKFCEERESSENEGQRGEEKGEESEEKGERKEEGQSEQSEKRERGERKLKVWPVWEKVVRFERRDALDLNTLYEYDLRAREAIYESDYEEIAELEQYHYASQKEFVAVWRCEKCHELIEANTKPLCERCGTDEHVHILEIKGSTPASRFLLLELKKRSGYEPRVLGYVRIDPPVPQMHRRLPTGEIVRNIRESVFEPSWFEPSFSPERELKEIFAELRKERRSKKIARRMLWEEEKWRALETSNTAVSRIARVVIHPDYRSDGLGQLAVRLAIEWVKERCVPEMRRKKHLVEVIAQMARFNPFFEKAGFKYLWDTSGGKPVLYFPLTADAERKIQEFLRKDRFARKHKGRLCKPSYGRVERLSSPIILENVTKIYSNEMDLEGISPEVLAVLQAFQVKHRLIQREVLRNLSIRINPGEIVCVVGASGAGKTTFLRILAGAALKLDDAKFAPDAGEVKMPENVRASVLIPGEFEPEFGDESVIEHVFGKCKDLNMAVEVLNTCGLSDAVLYRAKFKELSTGQKERAKIASLFAEKPNLIIVDEFAAHLDPLLARRIARKVGEMCRNAGITLVVATHRPEVKDALAPDKILHIGYGTYFVEKRKK